MTGGKFLVAFFLGFAASAVTLAALVLLYMVFFKKKPDKTSAGNNTQTSEKSETQRDAAPPQTKAVHLIHLTNLRQPDRKWLESVSDALLIGRHESCPVRLDDLSVSSHQCKITETPDGPVAINLSKTNETLVDGAPAGDGRRLFPGTVLALGREQLRVDYIRGAEDDDTEAVQDTAPPADAFSVSAEERFW